jgi:myo-inositol 2-dehydrogenase/D-chiro-inositol 1-dehydrogenase
MSRCKIGFVGAGGVALRHARHLTDIPDVEIRAVTDRHGPAACGFAEMTGSVAVPDIGALLDTSVDAVYVCVPPHAHGYLEEQIVAAGVALFVEKPLGIDVCTARRIADLAGEGGVLTAVGHHWRYSEAVGIVREMLEDRPIRLAVGSWLDRVPPVTWWIKRTLSGGQIVEQAVHVLDLIRLLVGEVAEVSAYVNTTPPNTPGADVDGASAAILRFRSGAVGTVSAACCLAWKHLAGLDLPMASPSRSTKTALPHGLPTGRYTAAFGRTTPRRPPTDRSSMRCWDVALDLPESSWTMPRRCGHTN